MDAARFSNDIAIFHEREERVARAAQEDAAVLEADGFALRWLRREPAMYAVIVERAGETTRLEWVVDADYRFFPTMQDDLFGYVLHPVDLATNKMMAAAGRRAPRYVVDLLTIHDRVLPIGAVVWAAVGKSLGFTPEGLIDEVGRLGRYSEADFNRLASDPPIDAAATMMRLRQVLGEADAFVALMPTDKVGLVFLQNGNAVQPNPARLDAYQLHAGQRRGQWPSSADISGAMFERYEKPGAP